MEMFPAFNFPTKATANKRKYHMDDEEIIRTNSYLKWIMFYTDVEHRVEPVLSGTRMVLQYDVMIPPPSSLKKRKFDELDEYGASGRRKRYFPVLSNF
jgi:hypothetical protein